MRWADLKEGTIMLWKNRSSHIDIRITKIGFVVIANRDPQGYPLGHEKDLRGPKHGSFGDENWIIVPPKENLFDSLYERMNG